MVKAVFFDWVNTIAGANPPKHELYGEAFRQLGIELSPKKMMLGILAADRYYFEEVDDKQAVRGLVEMQKSDENAETFGYYPKAILTAAGIEVDEELCSTVAKMVSQKDKGAGLVLYDDVLSTLGKLKDQGLIIGLLTNAAHDVNPMCREMGLAPYLDFVLTSKDAGVSKPDPRYFLAALERAGVKASEAVHVGDQYEKDIVGATAVGINPILIDRYDLYSECSYCPRIRTLPEIIEYL